jgi:hypothetical protein
LERPVASEFSASCDVFPPPPIPSGGRGVRTGGAVAIGLGVGVGGANAAVGGFGPPMRAPPPFVRTGGFGPPPRTGGFLVFPLPTKAERSLLAYGLKAMIVILSQR